MRPLMPPKRFPIGPLPEDHDELFTLWAWGKRRSKSALATHVVEARVEVNEDEILRRVQRAADRRGITFDEMKRRIMDNPRYGWDEEPGEELEDAAGDDSRE